MNHMMLCYMYVHMLCIHDRCPHKCAAWTPGPLGPLRSCIQQLAGQRAVCVGMLLQVSQYGVFKGVPMGVPMGVSEGVHKALSTREGPQSRPVTSDQQMMRSAHQGAILAVGNLPPSGHQATVGCKRCLIARPPPGAPQGHPHAQQH